MGTLIKRFVKYFDTDIVKMLYPFLVGYMHVP